MTPAILPHPSPNHGPRPSATPIDMLVLHYTGMETGQAALDRLCDPAAQVSAHYLIEEDGRIFGLVPEDRRAWHAGESFWRGHRDINSRSIGIELVNPGHEFGYRPFPDPQMEALIALARNILARHPIPARNVVGHSDIAPSRKQDPGELFDWERLATARIGLWPSTRASGSIGEAEAEFAAYGYETSDLRLTTIAFQRHFRPARMDGIIDRETGAILAGIREITGK